MIADEAIRDAAIKYYLGEPGARLVAFASAIYQLGSDHQHESDAELCMKQDGEHDCIYAEAIRNNKGD